MLSCFAAKWVFCSAPMTVVDGLDLACRNCACRPSLILPGRCLRRARNLTRDEALRDGIDRLIEQQVRRGGPCCRCPERFSLFSVVPNRHVCPERAFGSERGACPERTFASNERLSRKDVCPERTVVPNEAKGAASTDFVVLVFLMFCPCR